LRLRRLLILLRGVLSVVLLALVLLVLRRVGCGGGRVSALLLVWALGRLVGRGSALRRILLLLLRNELALGRLLLVLLLRDALRLDGLNHGLAFVDLGLHLVVVVG